MRKTILIIPFVIILFAFSSTFNLKKKWETEKVLDVPESVIYNPKTKNIYAACINGKPSEKDNNGYIAKISLEGKIIEKKWITGLHAPKGMGIYNGKLFVTDIDRIAEIDINTGNISTLYKAAGSKFMNDIAIDDKGIVYATCTATGKIYRLKNKELKVWIDSMPAKRPNGLCINACGLIIGTANGIYKTPLEKPNPVLDIKNDIGIDGIISLDIGYIFSDWSGHIYQINPKGEKKLLLNTAVEKIQAADICYAKEGNQNLILVPTFFDNRVMAYEF